MSFGPDFCPHPRKTSEISLHLKSTRSAHGEVKIEDKRTSRHSLDGQDTAIFETTTALLLCYRGRCYEGLGARKDGAVVR